MPEADAAVASFREHYIPRNVARRIPPHVTILFPFVPAARLDRDVLDAVRAHFGRFASFAAELTAIRTFPDHVWLAPEPRDVFLELIGATCERFPDYPAYGGEFGDHIPHLAVGETASGFALPEIVEAAERELAPHLPLAFSVDAVSLLVEQEDGTWRTEHDCPLAA